MKKIVIVIGMLLFCNLSVFAIDIIPKKILAITEFEINKDTINETKEISLYSLEDYTLFDDNLNIKKGEKFVLLLDSYSVPTRGKRNGTYKVTLKSPMPESGDYFLSGTMKPSTKRDFKGTVQNLGIKVVGKGLRMPGFSQAVAAAKGIIKPDEEKGRFRSVSRNVYETTPLKYTEKGNDFLVEPDGIVVIRLRNKI